jgi:hypothetical protein
MRIHHSLFGLADGDLEALGFAITLRNRRLRADGTVGVHNHVGSSKKNKFRNFLALL